MMTHSGLGGMGRGGRRRGEGRILGRGIKAEKMKGGWDEERGRGEGRKERRRSSGSMGRKEK